MTRSKRIRVIYFGTPEFAIPALQALLNDPFFDVIAVVTQPDRPAGRSLKIARSAIKEFAESRGLRIFQPEHIRDLAREFVSLEPDLGIVAAYSLLLPDKILNLPKYGCINIHASLLPKYRGASPIQAALLNGDATTGITIMKMDPGLDTGPILAQTEVVIAADDTKDCLKRPHAY